ncbi:MAG: hypothetical protein ACM3MD_02240 [Betaproteobacteria bacterium]
MMNLSRGQEKKVLVAVLAILALLLVYRIVTAEKPRTAPLAFPRGTVARSAVRQGLASTASGADPLNIFLAKREEKFPGVSRDIFRMENPAPKPILKKAPPVVVAPSPPPVPQKTPEEIAADLSRADLSRFRFLGYLTEKENTLFLSKDGELFIVKIGGRLLKNYQVKEASKDYVVLVDTVTHVEARVELSGSESQQQQPPQQFLQRPQQPMQPQMQRQMQQPMQQPAQQPQQKMP